MRKDIVTVDLARGIRQVTVCDERWYDRAVPNHETGLFEIEFRPSVTYICNQYPKGKGFERWLKKHGDEADEIAWLAAERGYKVHRAIAVLNDGGTVHIDDSFENEVGGHPEPITADEYLAVMSYVQWWKEDGCAKYEIQAFEYTIWPDIDACAKKYGLDREVFRFAGTIDLRVRRKADGAIGVIDMKTSPEIWPSYEMQVSAYMKAQFADWGAILQLDYRKNKKQKWKFTEVPDCFGLFCATRKIWEHETAGVVPLQRDYPLELSLGL